MTQVTSAIVELAGLPGAGKSTLAESLLARLGRDGIPCSIADAGVSARARKEVRMLRRTGYALSELAVEPDAARRATNVLVRSRQQARRDTAAVLAQWLATERLVSRGRATGGVRLLEEGLVQTVWTALLRSGRLRPEDLWACVPPASHTDLVLFLDVHPDLAARRLAARESRHSRIQQVPAAELLGELRRGQAILDDVLLSCPLRVARITSAGQPAEQLADAAAAAVHALVG